MKNSLTAALVLSALAVVALPGLAWADGPAVNLLPPVTLGQHGTGSGGFGSSGGTEGESDTGIDPVDSSPAAAMSKFPKNTIEIGLLTGAFGYSAQLAENVDPGYVFAITPSLGFFIVKGLELIGSVDLTANFGRYEAWSNDRIGFTFGVKYHLEIDAPVIPYFGVQMGFTIYVATPHGTGRESFVLNIPFGLLYPLAKGVFLDVGMQGRLEEPLNTGWNTTGSISLLRVGVRMFI